MTKRFTQLFFIFCLLLSFTQAQAQDSTSTGLPINRDSSAWKHEGFFRLTFNNTGLSNWAAGGENSIALGSVINFNAKYETKKSIWDNTLNLDYGIARVGDADRRFKKTKDQFSFISKYGYKLTQHWNISAAVNFSTQIQPGYTYKDTLGKEFIDQKISDFFSPAYILPTIGLGYQNKLFSAVLSPIANKITIVMDDSLSQAGAFGVSPGKNVRNELGIDFTGKMKFSPMENVTFETYLNLFANYETSEFIDVNWTTNLVFKINKYLNASFGTQLLYDHDILIPQEDDTSIQAIQFKHVLDIGLLVKF